MYNYSDAICGVILLGDKFYADVVDVDHRYRHVPITFYNFLNILTNKDNCSAHIHSKGILPISIRACKLPRELSDDSLSAIYTTVLHHCTNNTTNILPNIGLRFSSRPKTNNGVQCSTAVQKNLAIFPELYALMQLTQIDGMVEFELLDVDVMEAYNDVVGDITYIPTLLSELAKK